MSMPSGKEGPSTLSGPSILPSRTYCKGRLHPPRMCIGIPFWPAPNLHTAYFSLRRAAPANACASHLPNPPWLLCRTKREKTARLFRLCGEQGRARPITKMSVHFRWRSVKGDASRPLSFFQQANPCPPQLLSRRGGADARLLWGFIFGPKGQTAGGSTMLATRRTWGWCIALLLVLQAGCTGPSSVKPTAYPPRAILAPPLEVAASPTTLVQTTRDKGVVLASAQSPPEPAAMMLPPAPFEDKAELQVDALIDAVLARNPTLAQMVAAWQAASARYPQVTSLDDPMFGATVGPASIGSNDVDFAYRLEVSQKIPWHGKLGLRGQNALAEASAAGNDVHDVRLQLVESARTAFFDYYLVERALVVNEEAQRLLKEFRENALERFRNNQAPQQDVLQADVEIGRQRERHLILERMKKVAIARINTLMHLPTNSPLPPAPKGVEKAEALPDVLLLQERAVAQRPDLKALADRIAAEQASLGLAYKEFYPDFDVMAAYDAFWQSPERDLRPMLGVKLNLPVQRSKRHAAVAEAQARLAQRQADLARQIDQVNLQVEEAYQLVRESERAVRLYEETILPAARENVKAAIAAYTTGKVPFLSLIEAQRNLINLRDRYYETTADLNRRRATLERVIGGPLTFVPHDHPQALPAPRLLPPSGR